MFFLCKPIEMKFVLLFAAALAAASAVSYEDVVFQEYNLFKAQYHKSYETPLENFRRMEIFLKNKYEVAQHNLRFEKGEETYEMEINEFSDWLPEEIARMNGFNKDLRDRAAAGEEVVFPDFAGKYYAPNCTAPPDFNWVKEGVVTPVKNQGACGSCYAFSALGALESAYYMLTRKKVRLSEQQIVDCSAKFGNMGCNGGSTTWTYDYIRANGGVNTESSYPYEGKIGNCRYKKENNGVLCLGYAKIHNNEESLRNALACSGPIAISINAMDSFVKYKRGVYYDSKCKGEMSDLNHAVLLVGYGTDPTTGQDYWLIKNSWGTKWGEKGYIRLAMNKNNMCGVTTHAITPQAYADIL